MTPERRAYAEAALLRADNLSDGAFLAYLEEMGIGVEELVEVAGEEIGHPDGSRDG